MFLPYGWFSASRGKRGRGEHTKEGEAIEHSRGHETGEDDTQVLQFCGRGEGGG